MTNKPQFLHDKGPQAQKPFFDPFVYPYVNVDAAALTRDNGKRPGKPEKTAAKTSE